MTTQHQKALEAANRACYDEHGGKMPKKYLETIIAAYERELWSDDMDAAPRDGRLFLVASAASGGGIVARWDKEQDSFIAASDWRKVILTHHALRWRPLPHLLKPPSEEG